ncbi:hypothetical protein ACH436_02385 [Isoptericola sp. NPDC019693]|uniref:hypothetical protein n=1 Tax=Isoptericola sp. NPDC019693 TaxID=3364009 RepID=UPI00378CEA10
MQVLLCVGEDAASLAPTLVTAWREAAPSCEVRVVALPDPASPGGSHRAPDRPAAGVFVPLEALGLVSVAGPGEGPLSAPAAASDLVVVHLAVLDGTTLREGRVPAAVAAGAPHAVPVVVLAGRSEVSRREWSGAGVSGVHETGDDLVAATARVARTWAPSWA